jgi:hypothetical protein
MTTQVLISNPSLSETLTKTESEALSASVNQPLKTADRPVSGSSSQPKRELPYQTNHQVELLHLQAETEVLLQQLKVLQQQKAGSLS